MPGPAPPQIAFTALLLALACAPAARAAWPARGLAYCQGETCDGVNNSFLDPDGTGGALIVWERAGGAFGLGAQRITRDGTPAPGWPAVGVSVSDVPYRQFAPSSCPDGAGGTFVVWTDQTFDQNVRATRFTASGTLAPGWPENGLIICGSVGTQYTRVHGTLPDGEGGFYTVWDDYRNGVDSDVYCHRIRADGTPHPGWPVDGLPVSAAPLDQSWPTMVPDGGGGVFISWVDERLGAWLQHLRPDGSRAEGFPADGKRVLDAGPEGFIYGGDVVPDGAGGVFLIVAHPTPEDPTDDYDAYVMRLRADGTVVPGWLVAGRPRPVTAGLPRSQYTTIAAADGSGGVFVVWEDHRDYPTSLADVYVIRYLADGSLAPGFAATGNLVFGGPFYQNAYITADGSGGVYLACEQFGRTLALQHLRGDGLPAAGWPVGGRPVSDWQVSHSLWDLCGDGMGGAYVLWDVGGSQQFPRTGYLQRIVSDGVVSTLLSAVSHEASAERVRLVWSGASLVGPFTVERRLAGSPEWLALGEASWGSDDRLEYEDATVEPGATYTYRLGYTVAGLPATSGEREVVVPRLAAFALAGAVPDPARADDLRVRFSVPERGAVRLTLHDVHGRRVHEQTENATRIGVHEVRLQPAASLRPGLYWVTLQQDARRASARVTVVR